MQMAGSLSERAYAVLGPDRGKLAETNSVPRTETTTPGTGWLGPASQRLQALFVHCRGCYAARQLHLLGRRRVANGPVAELSVLAVTPRVDVPV